LVKKVCAAYMSENAGHDGHHHFVVCTAQRLFETPAVKSTRCVYHHMGSSFWVAWRSEPNPLGNSQVVMRGTCSGLRLNHKRDDCSHQHRPASLHRPLEAKKSPPHW
jgi:hypothetical protein